MPRFLALSPDAVDGVNAALKRCFRRAGKGSIEAAQKALGLRESYYSRVRAQRKLDLGVLLATLAFLEIDPADFFAELYGLERTKQQGGSEESQERDGLVVPLEPTGSKRAPEPARPPAKLAFGPEDDARRFRIESWLAEMDDLRYDDPEAALAGLRSRIPEVPASLGARWFAVAASCLRMSGDLRDARLCIRTARDFADGRDEELLANLLQRESYITRDLGNFAEALELAERAAGIYCRRGNLAGVAKTLVEQGQFLALLDQRQRAIRAVHQAMEHLPRSERRYWVCVHQYLAIWYQEEGELELAWRHAQEARGLAFDRYTLDLLPHMEARILEGLGRYEDAADKYEDSLLRLEGQYPLEGLLTLGYVVRSRILQGSPARAVAAAQKAASFIGAMKESRVAQGLILELCRLTSDDCSRESFVAELIAKLEAAVSATARGKDRLGDRLRRARRRLDASRKDIARRLGMSPVTLAKIEHGWTPGVLYEQQIEAWLKAVSPERLLAQGLTKNGAV